MKDETKGDERRSRERVPMRADKPVYLEINLDGSGVAILVENLSSDGASHLLLVALRKKYLPNDLFVRKSKPL